MRKISLMLGLALALSPSLNAQNLYPVVYSSENDRVEKMFSEQPDKLHMNFRIKVNKDVELRVSFSRVSDWKGVDEFSRNLNIASSQLALYRDTIKQFSNSKRLDIHIPESGNDIISRYSSSDNLNNLRITQGDGKLQGLKMAKDSLRIFQSFAQKGKKIYAYIPAHQYTFIAKDLSMLESVLSDQKWISKSAQVIDSVVEVYSQKWKNADRSGRTIYASYNPSADSKPLKFSGYSDDEEKTARASLIANGGFGFALVRNTLCPAINVGLQFNFAEYKSDQYAYFTRLSTYGFSRYEFSANNDLIVYGGSWLQLELGFKSKVNDPKKFLLSTGFGYMPPGNFDPTMERKMYKMFFNYGFSDRIVLQPEFVLGKKGWIGIGLNFQLF